VEDLMEDLFAGIRSGDRTAVGQAITLVESTRPDDRRQAQELLAKLLPYAGGAYRVGISGVPGAGKSTLIDALGTRLTAAGHRVGVLAVDPSSMVTGGSILGDKTRMAGLSNDERAFIRPSPSAGVLGGVTSTTPHVITVLEGAGYDIVLVETMGVGQSEAAVYASVDCLCVLALAGAGDELQAVKRGLLELADLLVVNKADGDNVRAAQLAATEFQRALQMMTPEREGERAGVMTVSAATGAGLDEMWEHIVEHRRGLEASGKLDERRAQGRLAQMRVLLERRLLEQFKSQPGQSQRLAEVEQAVKQGKITPESAIETLL